MAAKTPDTIEVDGLEIKLRHPEFAALLAWLIPGAGHYYQGRIGKAALYSLSILSLYFIGLFIGEGRVFYWSWDAEDRRWHYICQLGVGLPALPAAIEGWRGERAKPLFGGYMRKPSSMSTLDDWHRKSAHGFDLGGLFTMIAGLLNYLVIFDAYSGPLPLLGPRKGEKSKDDE